MIRIQNDKPSGLESCECIAILNMGGDVESPTEPSDRQAVQTKSDAQSIKPHVHSAENQVFFLFSCANNLHVKSSESVISFHRFLQHPIKTASRRKPAFREYKLVAFPVA